MNLKQLLVLLCADCAAPLRNVYCYVQSSSSPTKYIMLSKNKQTRVSYTSPLSITYSQYSTEKMSIETSPAE